MRRMWHLWPGQLWPFTREQEDVFARDLRAEASRPSRSDRDDLTALLGILRCGCSLEAALTVAPGLRVNRLLHVYDRLDQSLQTARSAWAEIVGGDEDAVPKAAEKASLLLPGIVGRVTSSLAAGSAESFRTALRSVSHQIDVTAAHAQHLEGQCLSMPPGSPAVIELGAELFHPHRPGVYASPTYLPDRVASLSSLRVSDLLGLSRF